MSVRAARRDQCLTIHCLGWSGLQNAKAMLDGINMRITYADGNLMLMRSGLYHELYSIAISDFIKEVARAFRIDTRSLGRTLYEREAADAAKEADAAFYVASCETVSGRMVDPDTDPVPDLAVEVQVGNPMDLAWRAYAGLGVPEVWHFSRRAKESPALKFPASIITNGSNRPPV